MDIYNVLGMLGGLALFLYGMKMMGDGLEKAAGDKMQTLLEKLTANRFVGVVVGALMTAAVQSSSATTVMVIGFVNSGLMKLEKAVWVIMGANIGTTLTSQLIALDVDAIAPLFAITGVVLVTFINNKKTQNIGEVIAGLGILFIGMGMMSDSMAPLRDVPEFVALLENFSNPFIGILTGALFTAVIQSSAASIGILQTLAASGVIPFQSAVYVLFGQNIGTCITSLLASLSANRNAKRATMVHFLFNILGTIVFVIACTVMPVTEWVAEFTGANIKAQIANFHTLFNIVTTVMLLPFGAWLAKITYIILPLAEDEKEDIMELTVLSEQRFGSSLVALTSIKKELVKMFILTKKSLALTADVFVNGAKLDKERIERNEKKIDKINYEINKFMSVVPTIDMSEADIMKCNVLFKLSVEIERIGDHIENLSEYAYLLNMKEIDFNEETIVEIKTLYENMEYVQNLLLENDIFTDRKLYDIIVDRENDMDNMVAQYRRNQVKRLKNKEADADTGVIFSEMLTDIERIEDYLLNVATSCSEYKLSFKQVR